MSTEYQDFAADGSEIRLNNGIFLTHLK